MKNMCPTKSLASVTYCSDVFSHNHSTKKLLNAQNYTSQTCFLSCKSILSLIIQWWKIQTEIIISYLFSILKPFIITVNTENMYVMKTYNLKLVFYFSEAISYLSFNKEICQGLQNKSIKSRLSISNFILSPFKSIQSPFIQYT